MAKSLKQILRRRDILRGTVCVGCRHNYYNYPKPASPRGDVAVAEDYHCWHIPNVDLRRKEPCLVGSYRRG